MYELHLSSLHQLGGDPDTEFVIACRSCTDLALQRDPAAYADFEPAAGPCELRYEEVCSDTAR